MVGVGEPVQRVARVALDWQVGGGAENLDQGHVLAALALDARPTLTLDGGTQADFVLAAAIRAGDLPATGRAAAGSEPLGERPMQRVVIDSNSWVDGRLVLHVSPP